MRTKTIGIYMTYLNSGCGLGARAHHVKQESPKEAQDYVVAPELKKT